ncbi:MAG: hypothetical protein MJD61_22580 [Proteobacteria bacterium]|nr:hypothetical protein [Pseudomonadota bacterium]
MLRRHSLLSLAATLGLSLGGCIINLQDEPVAAPGPLSVNFLWDMDRTTTNANYQPCEDPLTGVRIADVARVSWILFQRTGAAEIEVDCNSPALGTCRGDMAQCVRQIDFEMLPGGEYVLDVEAWNTNGAPLWESNCEDLFVDGPGTPIYECRVRSDVSGP